MLARRVCITRALGAILRRRNLDRGCPVCNLSSEVVSLSTCAAVFYCSIAMPIDCNCYEHHTCVVNDACGYIVTLMRCHAWCLKPHACDLPVPLHAPQRNGLLRRSGCPFCANCRRLTHDEQGRGTVSSSGSPACLTHALPVRHQLKPSLWHTATVCEGGSRWHKRLQLGANPAGCLDLLCRCVKLHTASWLIVQVLLARAASAALGGRT